MPVSTESCCSRFHSVEDVLVTSGAVICFYTEFCCRRLFVILDTLLLPCALLVKNCRQCLNIAQVCCWSFGLLYPLQRMIAFQRQIASVLSNFLSNKPLSDLKIWQSLLWKKLLWCSTSLDVQLMYLRATCHCTKRMYAVEKQYLQVNFTGLGPC